MSLEENDAVVAAAALEWAAARGHSRLVKAIVASVDPTVVPCAVPRVWAATVRSIIKRRLMASYSVAAELLVEAQCYVISARGPLGLELVRPRTLHPTDDAFCDAVLSVQLQAAIHCLKTTKDIADAETFIRSLMPSEEMLTYAPGDVGFAVFRAMQTQYRTRLLAVATRLRQAPEEAALLKDVDHAGLQRAVDDYCRALEESLPPPLLIEHMEQILNEGTMPSNTPQKKKKKKKKKTAAASATPASPAHATPSPPHAAKRAKRCQTGSPSSAQDDLERHHRQRTPTEARGTKETQGNGAGAGLARSGTGHRISPRDAEAATARQVSILTPPKSPGQKKTGQTQPTKAVNKSRPSDVFFAQSSAQRKELLRRLKAEQQLRASYAHDGKHIDDSDDDATGGEEEAAEDDGEEAAEADGGEAAEDDGEEAADNDGKKAAEDDEEMAGEEAVEDDGAEDDHGAEAQGASHAAGSQVSSMQASPASSKQVKLHSEPRIADKLKKHKKRKKHRKHKEHKAHSQRGELSPSRSPGAEETNAPILAASQEYVANKGKRVSYTAVAGGSNDYNDAQEERETPADDSDDDNDLQMLQTQLLETQIPYETQPY